MKMVYTQASIYNLCISLPYRTTMNYIISVEPYLNQYQKQYQNILVVNDMPSGPLSQRVVRINPPKLSPFNDSAINRGHQCIYAIRNDCLSAGYEYATLDDIPQMLVYLVSNGYKIDHDTTKLLQRTPMSKRVICVFSLVT
jgi:hypothetical protein